MQKNYQRQCSGAETQTVATVNQVDLGKFINPPEKYLGDPTDQAKFW